MERAHMFPSRPVYVENKQISFSYTLHEGPRKESAAVQFKDNQMQAF